MRSHFVQGSILSLALMAMPVMAQEDGMDAVQDAEVPAETAPSSLDSQPGDVAATAEKESGMAWMKDWHIGPAVSFSIPHPINYGIEVGYKKHMSFGFQTGDFDLDVSNVKIGMSNWDLRARWHPFQGSFFAGLAYGNQTLSIESDQSIEASGAKYKTTMALDVDTVYTTPHIGWIDATESGFLYGFEIGFQLANSSKAKDLKVTTEAGAPDVTGLDEYKKLKKDVEDAGETFGKKSLPHLGFKFGWMF